MWMRLGQSFIKRGSLGWILLDHLGKPIMGGCKFLNHNWGVKVLEAKAVMLGLAELERFWHRLNPHVEIESNSLEVVRLLSHMDSDSSEVDLFYFILLWRKLLASLLLLSIIFCKILKEENKVSHCLTSLASSSRYRKMSFQLLFFPLSLKGVLFVGNNCFAKAFMFRKRLMMIH